MNDPGRLVILGAGPTGLGAAFRLRELGYDADQVIEQDDRPGGLARSYVDGAGFTWDCGGHVQFSHDEPTLSRPDYVNGGAFAARPRGGA